MPDNIEASIRLASERTATLKAYYARYLTEVRGLSQSSVEHYYDALNNISRRLKASGLIANDIYEITNLEYLQYVKSVLYTDPDFIALNERGQRMYSAGLNNYLRFVSGEDIRGAFEQVSKLDIPLSPEVPITVTQAVWRRSNILRNQVIKFADYKCEIDNNHKSFISESTHKAYMEGHHTLPMMLQPQFQTSLDVYANIVCLCPICHRRIHYGLRQDREEMIKQIYHKRSDRLANSGIFLSKSEFILLSLGEQ